MAAVFVWTKRAGRVESGQRMIDCLKSVIYGFLIGIANIIPGVSGGSMALALGIYERLISAVGCFGIGTIKVALGLLRFNNQAKQKFADEWQRVEGTFLTCIAVGGAFSVVIFSKLIVWLLQFYHDPTYGFFSGLILVSILIPFKMLQRFRVAECLSTLLAIILVLVMTLSVDANQQELDAERKVELKRASLEEVQNGISGEADSLLNQVQVSRLIFFVLCGVIAISAMVLPGVSGSFVLILLGVYFEILQAVNELNIFVIALFASGCVFGLLIFTRVLKGLLSRFHDATVSFLTGLMIGSLVGLWPFRKFKVFGDDKVGFERVDSDWIIPPLDQNTFLTLVSFLVGSGLVIFFLRYDWTRAKKRAADCCPKISF